MKVLLVNPPQAFYPGSDIAAGNLPLGLLHIAAVLEKNGHEVSILDAFMGDSFIWESKEKTIISQAGWRIREMQKRTPEVVGDSGFL